MIATFKVGVDNLLFVFLENDSRWSHISPKKLHQDGPFLPSTFYLTSFSRIEKIHTPQPSSVQFQGPNWLVSLLKCT